MNKYIVAVIFACFSVSLNAQWSCRSRLGGFLKPIGDSNLMWAGEITGSQGYITNSNIANGMAFLGLDYTTNSSTFYFEGGVKYWRQKNLDTDVIFDNSRFGFREVFYKYRGANSNLTAGLHSAQLGDEYLLNERVLGLSYNYSNDKWNLNITAGSVSNDFARNGTFCSTCYLYDIIQDRNLIHNGSAIGKTNMAAFTLSFTPQKAKNDDAEFSSMGDEFSSMDEESYVSSFSVKDLGWAFYTEFGDEVDNSLVTTGLYTDVELSKEFHLKPEVLYQMASENNGLIYTVKLEKEISWSNMHRTNLGLAYYDFSEISEDAMVLNKYSNILAGEVLRLDAAEMPIFLFSLKHNIPKAKTHFKLQYASSNQQASMQEFDFQCGKIFFKHLQANAILGYVKSKLIEDDDHAVLGRIELRFNF